MANHRARSDNKSDWKSSDNDHSTMNCGGSDIECPTNPRRRRENRTYTKSSPPVSRIASRSPCLSWLIFEDLRWPKWKNWISSSKYLSSVPHFCLQSRYS
jgi:hypothetical protein